jgi:hypothetical protein
VIRGIGRGIGFAARAVGSRFDAEHAAQTAYALLVVSVVVSGALLGLAVSRDDLAFTAATAASLVLLSALAAAVDGMYVAGRATRYATGGPAAAPAAMPWDVGPATLVMPAVQDISRGRFTKVTMRRQTEDPATDPAPDDGDPAQDRG